MKKIAFGCDHVGFILKHEIVAHLVERDVEVIDKGTWSLERTDYPHYASQVALAVAGGEADGGIFDLWHWRRYFDSGEQVCRNSRGRL